VAAGIDCFGDGQSIVKQFGIGRDGCGRIDRSQVFDLPDDPGAKLVTAQGKQGCDESQGYDYQVVVPGLFFRLHSLALLSE
jgi:hypothetical protein